jgi:hypothetical protein
VPSPGCLLGLGRDTHQLFHLELQDVELACGSLNLGQQPLAFIEDAQNSLLDDDGATSLLHLPKADNVHPEPWNVVDLREPTVFTGFAEEEDRIAALDLHNGAVAELDRPTNPEVDFRERRSGTTHVVGSSGVEDPSLVVVVAALPDLCKDFILSQIHPLEGWPK